MNNSKIGHNQPPVVSIEALTPADRKRIKDVVRILNDSMTRVASEKELQKDEIDALNDTIGLDKKLIRKLAKVYFKANYNEEIESNNQFETFYDQIMNKDDAK